MWLAGAFGLHFGSRGTLMFTCSHAMRDACPGLVRIPLPHHHHSPPVIWLGGAIAQRGKPEEEKLDRLQKPLERNTEGNLIGVDRY